MANRFLAYPFTITKTANGYEVARPDDGPAGIYVFSSMADLTYWLSLNEQPLP